MSADFTLSRRGFLAGMAGSALLAASARGEAPGLDDLADTPLAELRRFFLLDPRLVYLNNGSLGPCPAIVLDLAEAAWRRLERSPVHEGYGPLMQEADAVRKAAATFLHAGEDELAVTRNTTEAMNLIAQGIELREGDRVLTTDHEHAGGSICWEYLARRRGIVIDKVVLHPERDQPEELVQRFAAAMTARTRVISVSHITYTTGQRLPIEALGRLAAEHGALLVVDGAQAVGAIEVDLGALGCDAYATSAHKWLLAPKGTGLLYVRRSARERIDPLPLCRGMGIYTGATGVGNLPGVIGLGAALDFFHRLGAERIAAHHRLLRARLLDVMSEMPLGLASPRDTADGAPMVSFSLPAGVAAGKVQQRLAREHHVEVRAVTARKLNALRVSVHLYTTVDELEHLARSVKKVLES